jgi:hypothetical protein
MDQTRQVGGASSRSNPQEPEPFCGTVILLEGSTRESVIAAFRCSAAGVFSRTESLSELIRCIERVSRGRDWDQQKPF